ncbi:MAG: 50S ribosomal protein L9 [Planctomycetes bacterium]|nr:50S ribosomal protein L9 [Planctomycetota bacterium]MBI3844340.1 50S ribosomal protein L9 [Planctomycetota bacterium]
MLLREDIEKLGQRGEVVDVRVGYARNFLLPRGYAMAVTPENLRRLELEKKKLSMREAQRTEELAAFAKRLDGASCTIEVKAGAEGHLYGSVSEKMIADAFKKGGIEIDERAIRLEKAIKETGPHEVSVVLHGDITAKVKVWVIEATEEKG